MNVLENINAAKYQNKLASLSESEEWTKENLKLYLQFRDDLFVEFELENNHKAQELFEICWQDEIIASGHLGVYRLFSRLVRFIK